MDTFLVIQVPVSSQESGRSCICVIVVSIFPFFYDFDNWIQVVLLEIQLLYVNTIITYMYVLSFEIQLSRGKVYDPINPTTFVVPFTNEELNSNIICRGLFCTLVELLTIFKLSFHYY